MNVASNNAVELASYLIENSAISWMEGGKLSPSGVSTNPVIALLNHSCDPNILRVQNRGSVMAIANRTIQENEEVSPFCI